MNLTYTVIGVVTFVFCLGITLWSYDVLSKYAGIVGKVALSVLGLIGSDQPMQYYYAQYLFPIGSGRTCYLIC